MYLTSLQWRHYERDGVSNYKPHDCLLNHLLRRRTKKTYKFRVTGLCAGNSLVTGEFPAQMASNAENVSIWWRHHVLSVSIWVGSARFDHNTVFYMLQFNQKIPMYHQTKALNISQNTWKYISHEVAGFYVQHRNIPHPQLAILLYHIFRSTWNRKYDL